jgi:hypothetical protein
LHLLLNPCGPVLAELYWSKAALGQSQVHDVL